MADTDFTVNGFKFQSKRDYEDAKKEYESIQYIKAKTDLSNTSTVLKLYNKLIDKKTFSTIIGYTFLKELQKFIILDGKTEEDFFPIYIKKSTVFSENSNGIKKSDNLDGVNLSEFNKYKKELDNYKIKNKNIKIVCFFLIIIILAMFILTVNADYSPFKNYKNQILEEYAGWKEELTEKERLLNQREKDLQELIENQNTASP